MTTARLEICDYCERYGRACGRDHTWNNVNAWHRDWRGNPRPVSVALINAVLGGSPGKLVGKRVTVPDGREGVVRSVYSGPVGYRAEVGFPGMGRERKGTGRILPARVEITALTPLSDTLASPGALAFFVLAFVGEILEGRDDLGMADLSSTALERSLPYADGDIEQAIREELEFRTT